MPFLDENRFVTVQLSVPKEHHHTNSLANVPNEFNHLKGWLTITPRRARIVGAEHPLTCG